MKGVSTKSHCYKSLLNCLETWSVDSQRKFRSSLVRRSFIIQEPTRLLKSQTLGKTCILLNVKSTAHSPSGSSWDVLWLFFPSPTMAAIFAPKLERLFLSSSSSSFLPSEHMSPPTLELLVMLEPGVAVWALCFILDVNSLSAGQVEVDADKRKDEDRKREREREEDSGERKGQASTTGFGRRLRGRQSQWNNIYRFQNGSTGTSTVTSSH